MERPVTDTPTTANDFPKLGIRTADLVAHVENLIEDAQGIKTEKFGAVNWGDLGIADIEYRLSMLRPEDGPCCVVLVEEASPGCGLQAWLNEQMDRSKFPNTYVECEW
jgi:hypothetical protein